MAFLHADSLSLAHGSARPGAPLLRPDGIQRPALLVLPGWDDHGKAQYDLLDQDLSAQGWHCRRGNLPDAGWPAAERARVNREDTLRQTLRDYQLLHAQERPDAVGVLGFSYGGYMAALLAGMYPFDWLVLRSPAIYPDADWMLPKEDLDRRKVNAYRHTVHTPEGNRALAACAAFKGDVLLVQSEHDQVVPGPVAESYAWAFGNARSVVRHMLLGADHELSSAQWRETYHRIVVDWLQARRARC
ncbi:alpha/beta hydrolase [Acidovorax sp.]|uniref:alpha/beta hydrolase n=1 Tax=Acidovorax sp. TaxID=1872122 RepID=UPI003D003D2E